MGNTYHNLRKLQSAHGGFDNGAIEYGYYEDNINLEIALKMKDELVLKSI